MSEHTKEIHGMLLIIAEDLYSSEIDRDHVGKLECGIQKKRTKISITYGNFACMREKFVNDGVLYSFIICALSNQENRMI